MRVCRLASLFVLTGLLLSCGSDARDHAGLIHRTGTHRSPDGQWSLNVAVVRDGIVQYTITDAKATQVLASDGGFSTYQRWFFHWDDQNQLWCWNSDTGPLVLWRLNESGVFHRIEVGPGSPLVPSIPPPVREGMPESARKDYGFTEP